jgi:hypothetical protein
VSRASKTGATGKTEQCKRSDSSLVVRNRRARAGGREQDKKLADRRRDTLHGRFTSVRGTTERDASGRDEIESQIKKGDASVEVGRESGPFKVREVPFEGFAGILGRPSGRQVGTSRDPRREALNWVESSTRHPAEVRKGVSDLPEWR